MPYQTENKKIKDFYKIMDGFEKFDLFQQILWQKMGALSEAGEKEVEDIVSSFRDSVLSEKRGSKSKDKIQTQKQLIIFLWSMLGSVIKDNLIFQLILAETVLKSIRSEMLLDKFVLGTVEIIRIIKTSPDKETIEWKVGEFIKKQTEENEYLSIKDIDGFDDLVEYIASLKKLIFSLNKEQKNLGFLSPEIIDDLIQNSAIFREILSKDLWNSQRKQ